MHKVILPAIIVAIFILGFIITKNTLAKIYSDIQSGRMVVPGVVVEKSGCDADCKKQIDAEVAKAVASISASPKIVPTGSVPSATTKPQDTYIQISGSGSTQNTDWTDVAGSDFSFDVNRDFSKGAKFAWEAFLRVANANGTAFARIYDVTHGIGVDGSEINIVNMADFTRANSTNMNFWNGRNVYRVQVKSLNTFNVDYMGGKIRISY